MRVTHLLGLAGLGALLLAGCDAAPGPADAGQSPPVLSGFSYSPQHVVLEQVPPEQVVDGHVRVPLTVAVTAQDADNDVGEVWFVLQSPTNPNAPVATGVLPLVDARRYETTQTVEIPVGAVGTYSVAVFAVDRSGLLSNQVRGTLAFAAEGQPPVIEKVEAFPEVVRPPTELKLVVTVTDPDGLDNLSRVEGRTPNGSAFELFDDGRSRGDETAGDGRYTATFDVPSATPGTQTFSFQAFDRTGLSSPVVEKDVTIAN